MLSCSVATGHCGAPSAQRAASLTSRSSQLVARPLQAARPLARPASSRPAQPGRGAGVRVAAFQIPSSQWWKKMEKPANVIEINSVQQLVDAMAGAGERLVIVDFFAPWCAACKSLYPKVMKLVAARPDVLLLAVNYDDNKTLVKALGVKVLPYFVFYRGASGKLDAFSASSKRIGLIQDAIELHSSPRCFLPGDAGAPVLAEFPTVQPKGACGSLDLAGATSSEEEMPVSLASADDSDSGAARTAQAIV